MKVAALNTIIFAGVLMVASSALAQTWTRLTNLPVATDYTIHMSPDGSKLVAVILNSTGQVFTSTNSGSTWISNNVTEIGYAVPSADGTKWVAAANDNGLWRSTNSGVTWYQTSYPGANVSVIACTADGSVFGTPRFVTTNAGATWISTPSPPPGHLFFPANGAIEEIVGTNGVFISTNLGTTWTTNSVPTTNGLGVPISADGERIAVVASLLGPTYAPGPIYVTTNLGISWLKTSAPSNVWTGVACSADGARLVAVAAPMSPPSPAYVGGIYTSIDGGVTWVSNSAPVTNWNGVTCSADGSKMAATVHAGGIYVSYSTLSPLLNVSPSGSSFLFFWTMPSTNFVLQQSLDLTANAWTTLTNLPALNLTNLQEQLTLTPTNDGGFFRLISQ